MSDNKYTDRLHGKMTFKCNQCDTRITEGEDIWGLCETCAAKIDWDALTGKNLKDEAQRIMRAATPNHLTDDDAATPKITGKMDLSKHPAFNGDYPNLTIETIKLDGVREDVGSELAEGKTNIICDIDGTIADVRHRLQFIKNPKEAELRERIASLSKKFPNIPAEDQQEIDEAKKELTSWSKDWDSFNEACWLDKPYPDVIALVERVLGWWESAHNPVGTRTEPLNLYFFSGRNDVARNDTIMWLEEHMHRCGVTQWRTEWVDHLLMRSEGDRRPDKIIKLEMAERAGLTPDNVLCIFDDRQTVVDMWRANGFRVMQVDAWKE